MNIYEDIAKRTNGEIYVGVVGPVRSGKSTFVKKFIDNVVIPNIAGDYDKERAKDETPQSASGRTIMTTEPKFVPDEAVSVRIGSSEMKVRLIDCVGYMVDGAIGGEENGESRMVMTPWSSEPMEFNTAAELGTKKVISDHSTVGIVVTTDGTIGDIPRESFVPAEERVVNELKSLNKPFVIILNSSNPNSKLTHDLAISLEEKYNAPVALVNALELGNQDFEGIFELILGQFGINELRFNLPKYFASLDRSHWLKESIIASIKSSLSNATKIDNIKDIVKDIAKNENVLGIPEITNDLGSGRVYVKIDFQPYLYYKVISELCGIEINDDENLFKTTYNYNVYGVLFYSVRLRQICIELRHIRTSLLQAQHNAHANGSRGRSSTSDYIHAHSLVFQHTRDHILFNHLGHAIGLTILADGDAHHLAILDLYGYGNFAHQIETGHLSGVGSILGNYGRLGSLRGGLGCFGRGLNSRCFGGSLCGSTTCSQHHDHSQYDTQYTGPFFHVTILLFIWS